MRRTAVCGCALLALVSVGAGCSSSKKSPPTTSTTVPVGAHPTTTPASTTSTRPGPGTTPGPTTATTSPPPVTPTALSALILVNSPDGFVRKSDADADTGPTNFAKAADDDLSKDAPAALRSAGFVRGYQRQWTGTVKPGYGTLDFVFLYQFETPEGAAQYAQHWLSTLAIQNPGGAPLQEFTPNLIPGAIGRKVQDATTPQANGGSTGIVIFVKGVYAVQAFVNGGPGVDESGPVSQLAAAQYLRLP